MKIPSRCQMQLDEGIDQAGEADNQSGDQQLILGGAHKSHGTKKQDQDQDHRAQAAQARGFIELSRFAKADLQLRV